MKSRVPHDAGQVMTIIPKPPRPLTATIVCLRYSTRLILILVQGVNPPSTAHSSPFSPLGLELTINMAVNALCIHILPPRMLLLLLISTLLMVPSRSFVTLSVTKWHVETSTKRRAVAMMASVSFLERVGTVVPRLRVSWDGCNSILHCGVGRRVLTRQVPPRLHL